MRPYYGVDFSGASDAGKRLWVARVRREGAALRLEALLPGRELPGGGPGRQAALAALVALVAREPAAAFGFDFPFALPAALAGEGGWPGWAAGFGARHATPEAFREDCRARTGGPEPKRETDRVAKVPFGGFNLRVYRQTYHGLRDVLAPLLAGDVARVLPMQPEAPGKASVIEICPASTLKAAGVYGRGTYKAKTAAARAVRAAHWETLVADFGLAADAALRARALDDAGGDALDAVIAACATARAFEAGLPIDAGCRAAAGVEGYIWA